MSAPLTQMDCDLRGMAFMPLDVIRLMDSDLFALSSGEEFKAAMALWCKSWLQIPAASLPDDDRVLAHLSGAGARWKKVKGIALRGFVKCDDGRLYHAVVAEKAREAWDRREEWQEKQNNKTDRQKRWRDKVRDLSQQLRDVGVTPPMNASLSTLERLLVDAKASTDGSHVDATETALTGTGTGTLIPLSNDNGPVADPDKIFWDSAKAYLGPSKASLIGKWVGQHKKPAVIAAISAAQAERAVDPVAFIEGIFRKSAGNPQPRIPI